MLKKTALSIILLDTDYLNFCASPGDAFSRDRQSITFEVPSNKTTPCRLDLPEEVMEKLKRRAESEDKPLEEIIGRPSSGI